MPDSQEISDELKKLNKRISDSGERLVSRTTYGTLTLAAAMAAITVIAVLMFTGIQTTIATDELRQRILEIEQENASIAEFTDGLRISLENTSEKIVSSTSTLQIGLSKFEEQLPRLQVALLEFDDRISDINVELSTIKDKISYVETYISSLNMDHISLSGEVSELQNRILEISEKANEIDVIGTRIDRIGRIQNNELDIVSYTTALSDELCASVAHALSNSISEVEFSEEVAPIAVALRPLVGDQVRVSSACGRNYVFAGGLATDSQSWPRVIQLVDAIDGQMIRQTKSVRPLWQPTNQDREAHFE
ncbi:hypothetical protein [Candidatus Rhodobacter oscarellae]|uniref:hypothetical protein n=1 Tax=Candidatus Rhodobacter oscarellae TaxID=1675527 RepID=UPI000A9C9BC4|nr:hypothetical protein [Candidatus Rhodobacter lobularis]